MHPLDLSEALEYDWQPSFEEMKDGSWRATVAGLIDFEIFGESREELELEWRDALASHLQGYLTVGKVIPVARISRGSQASSETGPAQHPSPVLHALRQVGNDFKLLTADA